MATFVLVHGAWAGALIWRPIAQALRKAGHEVYTPTLTGIGERRHLLNRDIDLGTHTRDVLGVIDYEDLADIVLVGHSYGGMVVTGIADAVPDKIASLIYLDAFVPEDGQSLDHAVKKDEGDDKRGGQDRQSAHSQHPELTTRCPDQGRHAVLVQPRLDAHDFVDARSHFAQK